MKTHAATILTLTETLDRWLWLLEVQSRLTSQLRRAIPEPSEALRHREAFATLAALADRAQATDTPLSALAHHAAANRREAREIERLQGHAEKLAHGSKTLATWKCAKASKRIDTKALALAHPDIASAHTTTVLGSRRFLLKDAT